MKKVLIVDDRMGVLNNLRFLCEQTGLDLEITAVLCCSAEDAETAIVENEPEVLFLDYVFSPDLRSKTGADIAKWIDNIYELPIAVATHTLRDEKEARELFEGTKCVTHFVAQDPKRILAFLKYATSL